ncbi:TPR domain-containing protein [Naegleria gruberi]|uniref:TPR domain-containing protein n=1 Tax=Naegleria gruberi TaxID=5762 RepID=D2UXK3_NAEGR|nr:TPR domain-containing protein [Naegleria gruberi]EFC50301.1 TPR domain-containing protein [Naegleria gruberi]|eukprot:XP_002683045.1 TPR domain-containing protein [Naegleria gruberi strain NEG-M]
MKIIKSSTSSVLNAFNRGRTVSPKVIFLSGNKFTINNNNYQIIAFNNVGGMLRAFSSLNYYNNISQSSTIININTGIEQDIRKAKDLLKEGFSEFENRQYLKSYELFIRAFLLFDKHQLLTREIKLNDDNLTVDSLLALSIGLNNFAETLRYMAKSGIVPPTLAKLGLKAPSVTTGTTAPLVYTSKDSMKFYTQAEQLYEQYQNFLLKNQSNNNRKLLELTLWKGTLYNNVGLYFMENRRDFFTATKWFEKSATERGKLVKELEELENDKATKHEEVVNQYGESEDPLNANDQRIHFAITRNNIAQCYSNSKQITLALESYNYALKVFEDIKAKLKEKEIKCITPESKNTIANRLHIIVLNNMGLMYHDLGKYEQSLTYFSEAFFMFTGGPVNGEKLGEEGLIVNNQIGTQYFGEELGVTLSNMGTSLFMLGRYRECEQFYRQAMGLFDVIYENTPNHKNIAQVSLQLALCLKQKHSAKEGEKPNKDLLAAATSLALAKQDPSYFIKLDSNASEEMIGDEKQVRHLIEKAKKITSTFADANTEAVENTKKSMFSKMFGKKK